jgi:hypothetical protein
MYPVASMSTTVIGRQSSLGVSGMRHYSIQKTLIIGVEEA